jgi:hypothetical protein
MKKLKLDLDALQVETFEAERTPKPRGTVPAHASSGGGYLCANQCVALPSQHCSAWECNSIVGCMSNEYTCNCTIVNSCACTGPAGIC